MVCAARGARGPDHPAPYRPLNALTLGSLVVRASWRAAASEGTRAEIDPQIGELDLDRC